MGEVDTERQALNVARMRLLGAEVIPVTTGSRTLKDAINEALRDWVTNVDEHALPARHGRRAAPVPDDGARLPPGHRPGGPRAGAGARRPAAGRRRGLRRRRVQRDRHLPRLPRRPGRAAGRLRARRRRRRDRPARRDADRRARRARCTARCRYLLQDDDGQTSESYSISAGLDYPGVGPEHALLKDLGRAEYRPITDAEAMDAFALLCRTEGIIPAIESAHAIAGALQLGRELGPGRGGPGQPVRPRRQGRRHRGEVVRHDRREESAEDASGTAIAEAGADATGVAGSSRSPTPAGARPGACSGERRREIFAGCRAEGRGALVGYLPAGYPTVDGSVRAADRAGRGRLRPARGRRALLRPGDGRPDHPGRRRDRAARRHPAARRCSPSSSGSPRPVAGPW